MINRKRLTYILIGILAICLLFCFNRNNGRVKEISILKIDDKPYIDWNLSIDEPWDELIINQTDKEYLSSLPHSISFLYKTKLIKTLAIPGAIVFFINDENPVQVLKTDCNNSLFAYLGERHLSSDLSYGLQNIMTIGDGFWAKCYLYKQENNYDADDYVGIINHNGEII